MNRPIDHRWSFVPPPPPPPAFTPAGRVRYRAACPGCRREAWWTGIREYNETLATDRVRVTVLCTCPGGATVTGFGADYVTVRLDLDRFQPAEQPKGSR